MRIANVLDENDPALVAARSEGGAMTLDEAVELALSPIDSPKTPDEPHWRHPRWGVRFLSHLAYECSLAASFTGGACSQPILHEDPP